MNIAVQDKALARQATRLSVIDCDIHPQVQKPAELQQFLSDRWRQHTHTYSNFPRQALAETLAYPRMTPDVARRDAWPPNGAPPGSDLDFMREQHLDANGIEIGILIPLRGAGSQRNIDYGTALARAVNEWQVAYWLDKEPRLRGSILVNAEDPIAAAKEIERCATDKRFVQVLVPPRAAEPLGRKRYWPMYEAAAKASLPIGMHVGGVSGSPCTNGSGAASYYIEEHQSMVPTMQSVVTSMVLEGLFEAIPELKVACIEGSFAWLPALKWRLDKHWNRMRDEVPHVKRPPSEYVRDHFWFTTQPIEEPDNPADLVKVMSWIGWDRIMFSTDYPHWDFDDPRYAFKTKLEEQHRRMIFSENARALYRLDNA
jgi:predicted TIM-barrel fold metal-dependent hydrolase